MTYDSKLGSTAEVAKFKGGVLSEQGASIAVKPFSEVDELETYDSVIIGSAIRYDRWLLGTGRLKFLSADKQLDAVVHDAPVLAYYANTDGHGSVQLTG